MAGVYVFKFDDVDFDTTGLVGDLQPVECTFYEEKNGESNLTMRLCYDPLNKWAAVKVGSYIKAQVPVRVPPKITDNAYDQEIMTWRVKTSIEKETTVWVSAGTVRERDADGTKALFYNIAVAGGGGKPKEVKRKRYLSAGSEVQVLEQRSDGRVKVYSPKFGTGWTLDSNLEQVASSTIPATFAGVESVVTPTRLQYQLFQVTSVEQTLDGVSVTAQHVFYELLHTVTNYKAKYPVEAFSAINGIFDGMVTADERFTCLTDASHKAGALDYERVNMVQALLDPENGICAQYGLSLIRDNYDLYALKNVGSDRGFVVEYGKNMLSVERTEDISNVVTRIIPFGKDKKGNMVYMDGCIYADSAHVEEYAMPRTMYLDCSDTAAESDTMTLAQVKAELKARAEAEFAAGCDLPELTMTVDFISLGDTEEYKQYRNLDKVYLFDRITVKDKVRGYDYNAEVVAVTHNVLTGQLESVTLGSVQKGTGIRKIATWQVPEVDGANIRLQSIAAGVLAGGAVGADNLQDNSVDTRAIVAESVTAEKLAAASVTADKIAAGAITADFIEAGSITADKLNADSVDAEYAKINFANINNTAVKKLFADTGLVTNLVIKDGKITGELSAVTVNADTIQAGTLSADRLILQGDDGLYYKINASSSGLTQSDLTEDQYKNYIDGSVLVAKSVTTTQLAAESVTANEIAGGTITAAQIATNTIEAANIKGNTITTNQLSSEVGDNLNLSSNKSINSIVSGLTQTFAQFEQPSGTFNVGDVWVKTQASQLWNTLKGMTWEAVKDKAWGEWGYTEQPMTYVWNGAKWVLTVDYNIVTQHSTEIRQTTKEIALKANKSDPAGSVSTSTVTIDADGVNIRTGGAFTVESGNFDIDSSGNMSANLATLNGATVFGKIQAQDPVEQKLYEVLSQYDIHIGTEEPKAAHKGMVWIQPDTSTSAQVTFSAPVTWGERKTLSTNPRNGTLNAKKIEAVGTVFTYRAKVPVYIGSRTDKGKTGAVLRFDVYTDSAMTNRVLSFEQNVTETTHGTGDKIIEMELTSGYWYGSTENLYYKLSAEPLADYMSGRLMNTSNQSLSVALVCISTGADSSAGWRDCSVKYYA